MKIQVTVFQMMMPCSDVLQSVMTQKTVT